MLREKFDDWYIENIYFGTGVIGKVHNWLWSGWRSTAYYFIHNALRDPYKKERKTIPRFHWEDRDVVMENFLYEIFLNYCHDENPRWKTFYHEVYEYIPEEFRQEAIDKDQNKIARRVEIYDWITKGRHEYQKRLDEDFSCELEDEFFAISTKYLMMIVEIRGELWT